MKKRRREFEIFSMSFLDCICCGFGAIVLLFVLSKAAGEKPPVVDEVRPDLSGIVAKLEEELHELSGTTRVLNRDLKHTREQISENKEQMARLQGDLSDVEGEFAGSKSDAEVQNELEGRLLKARQELTAEMKRLQALQPRPKAEETVGGIPVDSEYIVFIIDTSGSMQNNAWGLVQQKIRETLEVYPKVKGIQVMNDMGNYLFPQYRGTWIPDTPARRKGIVNALRSWTSFSNSSPVEGIQSAVRTYFRDQHSISLYIFGDEFSGGAMLPVLQEVERVNLAGRDGKRRVRIHAVGFPVLFEAPTNMQATGIQFATLMRAICKENGGTFVGLNSTKP